MTPKDKIFFGAVVVVAAIIANLAVSFTVSKIAGGNGSTPSFGSVGNLLAENYIPYIRLNGGYNSADPISTSGAFTATGGATVTGGLTADTVTFSNTLGNITKQTVLYSLVAATGTPCNLQNPFSATSTVDVTLNITTATSAPVQLVVATSTQITATTSTIGIYYVNTNNQATIELNSASSTGRGIIVGPSQWVNIGSTATTAIPYTLNGVYTIGGTCEGLFTKVI